MPELEVLFADDDIVVVIKPGGLLAVPGRGTDKQDCVVSRLKQQFPAMIAQPAVHRLDLYTSGLMVVAITASAHRDLCQQFAARVVHKEYLALVEGQVDATVGEIRLAFRLDPDHRPNQIYDPVQGKVGISRWQKIGQEGKLTRILFTPLTGRTHQLRLHAAHQLGLGCPIAGDHLYGHGRDGDQMLLHASRLEFRHPRTNLWTVFTSLPPF